MPDTVQLKWLTFIALCYGASLIWIWNLEPYIADALAGLMYISLLTYLFAK